MPGLDGLDFARLVAGFADPPAVVFVTAHDECAVTAFELGAVDYLLKPVEPGRLARPFAASNRPFTATPPRTSPSPGGDDPGRARRPDPVRSRSRRSGLRRGDRATTYGCTPLEGSYLVRMPLAALGERWAAAGFIRIHRSTLVAAAHISELRFDGGRAMVQSGHRDAAGQPAPHPGGPRPARPSAPGSAAGLHRGQGPAAAVLRHDQGLAAALRRDQIERRPARSPGGTAVRRSARVVPPAVRRASALTVVVPPGAPSPWSSPESMPPGRRNPPGGPKTHPPEEGTHPGGRKTHPPGVGTHILEAGTHIPQESASPRIDRSSFVNGRSSCRHLPYIDGYTPLSALAKKQDSLFWVPL